MKKDLMGVYDSVETTVPAGSNINVRPSFVYEDGHTNSIAVGAHLHNTGTESLSLRFNGSTKVKTLVAGAQFFVAMPILLINLANASGSPVTVSIFMVDNTNNVGHSV